MEFFRHCPQCGRRFHIKLESKKLVTSHQETIPTREPRAVVVRSGSIGSGGIYGTASITPIEVQEGRPIIVEVEEFQYAYKCKHCGHEWSERHIEEKRED
jgi:DNA-directed RNA polymerase subunit RPC12/RpoP